MEPPPPPPSEMAIAGILARAEQALAQAGERLLVERLHRALDEGGSTALGTLSDTLLPLVQALVVVLPQVVADGASPAILAAARTLGAALRERDMALPDLSAEGLQAHDRLLHEIAGGLRANDRTLVTAILHISHALLEVERAVLLGFQQEDNAALAEALFSDPLTGLASRAYFERRLTDQLQLVRRAQRPMAFALMALDDGQSAPAGSAEQAGNERLHYLFAALLRTQLRGTDVAARRADGLFALLLPETGRDDALVLLERVRQAAATHEVPLRFSVGLVVAPAQGLTDDALIEQAEQALTQARQQAS